LKQDRLEYFVDGVMLDKAGDLELAASRYRSASDGMKHANIAYNIADLERRMEDWRAAIEMYKKYLELAPDAPDRAAVQKLIEQIEKTPQAIYVDGEDLDGVVFIDGKPAGPSPLATTLTEGRHVVDRIGPSSHSHRTVMARPMQHEHITSHSDDTGNVVLSTSSSLGGSWKDGKTEYQMNARFALPPGRYDTYFMRPGWACSPLSFEVPKDGLVYVFIDAPKEKSGECIPIKVTSQKIQFPGMKK